MLSREEKMKAIAFLIVGVICVFVCGRFTDAWFEASFQKEVDARIEQELCMIWAFGDDWKSIKMRDKPERWNSRHGDLFIINMTANVDESKAKILKAWVDSKDEPAKRVDGCDVCVHPNLSESNSYCTVYYTDGSYCVTCPDCGEYVNSKE